MLKKKRLYLEASAAMKIYRDEFGSSDVEGIIRDFLEGEIELCTSKLTLNEIIRGLSKQGLAVSRLEQIESDFLGYGKMGLRFIDVSDEILKESLFYIKKHRLFVSDAIHLASAVKHADILVTDDGHLLKSSLKTVVRISIMRPDQCK